MNGIDLIAAERRRQINSEGWTSEHDDGHADGDLGEAAACYAMTPDSRSYLDIFDSLWPWPDDDFKGGDRIRELVKAGALIAAEIDRLQRASSEEGDEA